MSNATYEIGVAQYRRYDDNTPTFHWAVVVRTDYRSITCYQIMGVPRAFRPAPAKNMEELAKSTNFRGALKVGEFQANKFAQLETIIDEVPICNDDPNWNCQYWVVSVLEHIRSAGILSTTQRFTREFILEGLCQVREKWEVAESTFCDED